MLVLATPLHAAHWLRANVHGALCTDHRQLRAGDGFLAWRGARSDARAFVAGALAGGAGACLVELDRLGPALASSGNVAAYAHLKRDAAQIAALFYDQPSSQLKVLAVTGTNGKTSTAWWLAQALSNLQSVPAIACALIGTLGIGPAPRADATDNVVGGLASSGLTTPDGVLLQQSLRRFVDSGFQACALEASSVGMVEHRLDGIQLHTAIFTNLTQDHLDYHGSMADYWRAKAALFDWPALRAAAINIDDEHGAELARALSGKQLDLWTLSCTAAARLRACDIGYQDCGLRFTVLEAGAPVGNAATNTLQTSLIGDYNVANLLAVIAGMRTLGVPLVSAIEACRALTPVPGRMQCLGASGQPLLVVDYAHTPDALAKALQALRRLARQRGGNLWCIFGCGGDRDAGKRPLMGAIAAAHADRVVVTSDNPRSEKPDAIISQILLGMSDCAVTVESDRAAAIANAVAAAGAADVLLLAGKGHEDYQEVLGQRQHFSDVEQAELALQRRAVRNANAESAA